MFTCKLGAFRFWVMFFALMNTPATLQRMAADLFRGLHFVQVYIADVVIYSCSIKELFSHVTAVFERIRTAWLKLKQQNCYFARGEIEVLGHIVSSDGIEANVRKLGRFLALACP